MDQSNPSSPSPSRSATPNPATTSRFTAQASTAEDILKEQTVGLVHLSDFRKRRAEALEQKERERQDCSQFGKGSGSGRPMPGDGASTPQPPKKKRKNVAKGKLSFGLDDDDDDNDGGAAGTANSSTTSTATTPRSHMPSDSRTGKPTMDRDSAVIKKRLGPNAGIKFTPKAMTKSALLREAQTREQLRKEFIAMRDAVKATEIMLPFVFYDGTNIPGGVCKVKKGDHIWLFLDKARKVGAELGVGGGGAGDKSRREWARVGVDDLMLVRGEIIIPHHYEFYYFILNNTIGFSGPIFPYSAQPTAATPLPSSDDPATIDPATYDPLAQPKKSKKSALSTAPSDADTKLEGWNDDPSLTKVVDRRWYERNKHIFPASVWEEFDPGRDYAKGHRRDAEGNSFFFS
ncbi:XAP5-domain-containing protein [Lepidopterella palustris CBS 459.81]|uniref:XAP5-domain-containing protein n=1 Tax=Lepidopterella palustris CBS 459.81 TaxID=1314670 RepID=A0A8E2JG15_9PEZI|nr:XAP5-domain-containing protein [Lepidopterella palustris CBS 459.81]